MVRINKYNSNGDWFTFSDLLWVSWKQNTGICLHTDNSDIDISPRSLLVAMRLTSGRFCCTPNKAFWSTKHLLQLSWVQKTPFASLLSYWLPSQTEAQAPGQLASAGAVGTAVHHLAQLTTYRGNSNTMSSYKWMYLSSCFSEASLSWWGWAEVCGEGQSIATYPQTNLRQYN